MTEFIEVFLVLIFIVLFIIAILLFAIWNKLDVIRRDIDHILRHTSSLYTKL